MINIEKELIQLEKEKQLREIPLIETKSLNKILINEKEYINFASNDYLGISTNNELRQEFLASNESLMSSASARLLSGTSQEFVELENVPNLANYKWNVFGSTLREIDEQIKNEEAQMTIFDYLSN